MNMYVFFFIFCDIEFVVYLFFNYFIWRRFRILLGRSIIFYSMRIFDSGGLFGFDVIFVFVIEIYLIVVIAVL